MSEQRYPLTTIPLNTRQLERIAATEKRVNELRPHWEGAVAAHGAVIGAILDKEDIDAATVTEVKIVDGALLVTTSED